MARRSLPVEDHRVLAGVAPAAGFLAVVTLLFVWLPDVAFVLAFLGQLVAFFGLLSFSWERDRDVERPLGEVATYDDDGVVDAWVDAVAPGVEEPRRRDVLRTTQAFLVALLVGSALLTLFGGRIAAVLVSLVA